MEKRMAMDKKLKEQYDQIRNECGHEGTFRMVISYILDKGYGLVSEITEEEITEMVMELEEKEKNRTDGMFSLMTPEFQGELVRMAVKFTKVGTAWQLMKYIQNEVFIAQEVKRYEN